MTALIIALFCGALILAVASVAFNAKHYISIAKVLSQELDTCEGQMASMQRKQFVTARRSISQLNKRGICRAISAPKILLSGRQYSVKLGIIA
jgi:hypothetical protein